MKTFTPALVAVTLAACTAASNQSPIVDDGTFKREEPVPPTASATASSTTEPPPPLADAGSDVDVPEATTPDVVDTEASAPLVINCSGSVNSEPHGVLNVAWTYVIDAEQACATAGASSGCAPCTLFQSTSSVQCPVAFAGPPDARPWEFQFNPVSRVVYIKAVTLNPATWTPACP